MNICSRDLTSHHSTKANDPSTREAWAPHLPCGFSKLI